MHCIVSVVSAAAVVSTGGAACGAVRGDARRRAAQTRRERRGKHLDVVGHGGGGDGGRHVHWWRVVAVRVRGYCLRLRLRLRERSGRRTRRVLLRALLMRARLGTRRNARLVDRLGAVLLSRLALAMAHLRARRAVLRCRRCLFHLHLRASELSDIASTWEVRVLAIFGPLKDR